MNNFLIHGEYSIKSYERLQSYIDKAKTKNWEIVRIDPKNGQNVRELLSSQSLFNQERLFIIEEIKTLSKKDLDWIKKNNSSLTGNLVIYSDSEIGETIKKNFVPTKKEENFKLPLNIFSFLDSFYPGNEKVCIKSFHEILKNEPFEFVSFLLTKHLRDIYWVKVDPSTIPYPSWRVGKLEKQANHFSLKNLKKIINSLAEADFDAKTGKGDLEQLLDLIIIQKLEL